MFPGVAAGKQYPSSQVEPEGQEVAALHALAQM